MKKSPLTPDDLRGVFSVPPLVRKTGAGRPLDFDQSSHLVAHMAAGGITRFLYGGNAFLYHLTLAEYEQLLEWMAAFAAGHWAVPSVGPSYGRAMDQAPLLRRHGFPVAMALPCGDPRDAEGLEAGLREIADAAGLGLIVYLKEEGSFGSDREAGLDAVARLVDAKVCVAIKYAVVRPDPAEDPYLEGLLRRVDRRLVVSGIGERPAVVHMRRFALPGFTTGSGCLAPRLSCELFRACSRENYTRAEALQSFFLPLEDKRDAWGPARVLHAALELADVVPTGPIPPFVTALGEGRRGELRPVARELLAHEMEERRVEPAPGVVGTRGA
jgi:dihydrodipicolinate synthase/N-acetylneuraminate lyase